MKTIVVLSGGLDSTTLLYKMQKESDEIKAISFDYGQKHKKELDKARESCALLNIEHKIINIDFIKEIISKSSLTSNKDVPEGHYADENMKSTVVPNRNMILASLAIGYAVNEGFDTVALGVHSGDHAIYPDCRPEFIEALNKVSIISNYQQVEVVAPFINTDKAGIVKEGIKLGVDYSKTWTCYNGREKACGKCGSCQERIEAFMLNNIKDPIQYE